MVHCVIVFDSRQAGVPLNGIILGTVEDKRMQR
jgi:hypothetical protein